MDDRIVLDSSVIAAIFFPERITGRAIEIASAHDCVTVDLAYPEVANVAWKRSVHAGNDPLSEHVLLESAIAFIQETCDIISSSDLISSAFDFACKYRVTVYDALFIAAAVQCGVPLATADNGLFTVAEHIGPAVLVAE